MRGGVGLFYDQLSFVCSYLNLNQSALWELSDRDAGAGRLGAEVCAIDSVKGGKVAHIGEEAGGFDHVFLGQASLSEDGVNVFHDPLSLHSDVGGL